MDYKTGWFWNPLRELIISPGNFFTHGGNVGVFEWEVSGEEDVEDEAAGPSVGLGPVVAAALAEDLRRGVRRRAAGSVEEAVLELLRQRGEPEVGDLEVAVAVEEEILRLQVAVRHAVAVAEPERRDELLEVAARGGLRKLSAAGDFGEELAAGGELHDEVDLGFGGEHLVDFEDVRVVVEAAHGVDLADYAWLHAGVNGFRFVDDFHGHGGTVDEGSPLVDLGEAATAEEARQLVLSEDGGSARWRLRLRRLLLRWRFHGLTSNSKKSVKL